jgi:hypothetical protein
VISSCKIVMPSSFKCWIFDNERAVAKTVQPFLWNPCARWSPMPLRLQPVILRDF